MRRRVVSVSHTRRMINDIEDEKGQKSPRSSSIELATALRFDGPEFVEGVTAVTVAVGTGSVGFGVPDL